MSELPDGIAPGAVPDEVDSASGIVLRREPDGPAWQVLLGRRSRRSRFMPGHLVFPGGVMDPGDRPAERGAHARCVAREVAEESALQIEPGAWLDAGVRTTPPMFPRRFRNRFFVTLLPQRHAKWEPQPATEEFEELEFRSAADALDDWAGGRASVPPPVLPILRLLADHSESAIEQLTGSIAEANALEERAPRIEFAPGIWALPVRTATLPPATHTNVWMPGGAAFVVIDPGSTHADDRSRLDAVIERRRRHGGVPVAVVLTHGHRDHTAGAIELGRRLGVPLRAHPVVLSGLGAAAESDLAPEPISDGDRLELAGLTLHVLHTPGHAPGHLAFHVPEREVLIAGDLISGLSTILIDPDHGDMGAYFESLRRVRDLPCRQLFPGHGPPLPARALERLIAHREQRERRVLDQVSEQPTPLERIAPGAYSDLPGLPAPLIERQALSHLIHLERRGCVRSVDASRGEWVRENTESA